MRSEAEEKIRFVITVFRVIGWPLAVVGLPLGTYCTLFYSFAAMADPNMQALALMSGGILAAVTAACIWPITVIGRMKRRDLTARGPAGTISAMLFPACLAAATTGYYAGGIASWVGWACFPILAAVGAMCLYRVQNWYEAYCREPEFAEQATAALAA